MGVLDSACDCYCDCEQIVDARGACARCRVGQHCRGGVKMNNGGPAFPSAGTSGMTLRDWFAGQILQGMAADWPMGSASKAEAAQEAYLMADAMLEARDDHSGTPESVAEEVVKLNQEYARSKARREELDPSRRRCRRCQLVKFVDDFIGGLCEVCDESVRGGAEL